MHIRILPQARKDLRDIHSYIADHNLTAADKIIDKILYSLSYLETFPLLGKPGRVDSTRELFIFGTPYIVVYSLPDPYHIDIQTIVHGSKKYP